MKFCIFYQASLLIFITMTNSYSQEKDLKDIYTTVTNKINTALLTKKGALGFSGSIYYNYLKTTYNYGEETINKTIQTKPEFQYFVFNNVSFGIILSYSNETTEYKSSGDKYEREKNYIGPQINKYFTQKRLRPYIFTNYLFLTGDLLASSEINFGFGILYHLSGNIGLNTMINYGIDNSENKSIKRQNRIFVGIGISSFIL